ncbi:GntR family transcriptional regulator [Aeoliella sp. SH292]|uniref:GntR family transcriptional regulator n=1 Tax=Aeoliella sp. SH292 TaxID=3454464 RepID=UPI003F993F24
MTTPHPPKPDLTIEAAAVAARPKYQQAYEALVAHIRSGGAKAGEPLPTELQMVEWLGFSRNTVRQALARLESEGLIERVQGRGTFVAESIGKRKGEQLDSFALIAPDLRQGDYPSLLLGFELACSADQYQTVVANSMNDVAKQGDIVLQLIDERIGGVAMVPVTWPTTPAYQIRQLQRNRIPVVLCHRSIEGVSAPAIIFSGVEQGRLVGQILRRHHHRHVAMIYSHEYAMSLDRLNGLREVFAADGLDDSHVATASYGQITLESAEVCARAIRQEVASLMSGSQPPTAIFCHNTPDAEVTYLHLRDLGFRVPQDVSLLRFGGAWEQHGLGAKISGIVVDEQGLGKKAAELLHEMRAGLRAIDDTAEFLFATQERVGETLADAPR